MTENYLEITAPVFDIQTFSIHDGPGIRVTVFVKGCPLRCPWCANPESNLAKPQLMVYDAKCAGCGKCIPVCPNQAITLRQKNEKVIAVTDRERCTDCGICTEDCFAEARVIKGKSTSVREAMEKVLADRMFMENSGGGLTVSGGECLIYPEFTAALLYAAKREGINTAIETTCFAGREVVDQVFQFVDLGLLDVKHMNAETHQKLTGVSNQRILDNIRHIYHDLHVPVTIRVPVIPGYNDDETNIRATAEFAKSLGDEVPVHLLPYHRLGESKNESLGKKSNLSISVPNDDDMENLRQIVISYGIQAQIGG